LLTKQQIISSLEHVDWDFPGSRTSNHTVHSFHWFPGNFIPQIPGYLIQLLSNPQAIVFDPFCGSGTTGVEALKLGRCAWMSDLNQVSMQITRGKVAGLVNPLVRKELTRLLRELVWDDVLRSDAVGRNDEGTHPELRHWFAVDTLSQLRYLWKLVETSSSCDVRNLLTTLFSDVLYTCASVRGSVTRSGGRRRHHWGWIADNVKPKKPVPHNAIKLFRERVYHACIVLEIESTVARERIHIERQDARFLQVPPSSVDLVVTSPPYLAVIDYALANRMTYLWMGWAIEEDRNSEIGARYRRRKGQAYDEYLNAMSVSAQQITRCLRDGAYCAIIIGASRKFPGAAKAILDIFAEQLNTIWGPKCRNPSRRRVSSREGTSPVEWLCVFQKIDKS
jgi:hypothetical protein